jgi:hypothetical protein
MIFNHRYGFIFVKTRKVGGTAVEIALSKYCGEDDIITPIEEEDEEIRTNLGYPSSRNFRKKSAGMALVHHAPAKRIKAFVGPDTYKQQFKFTIERNPWEKVVSAYFWRGGQDDPVRFGKFVRRGGGYRISDFDCYCINGVLAVDQVIRYEQLQEGLDEIASKLALPGRIDISAIKAKGNIRPKTRSYREYYDEETRELIRVQFAREIAMFGFSF